MSGERSSFVPPASGKYRLIYVDPPWIFATYSERGKGRSAEAHYRCMSLDELCGLPVAEWAAEDCVLLMWATDPLLPVALKVIEAWGFKYKTVGFYWAKLKKHAPPLYLHERDFFVGMGFWTRANVEPCLLATHGHPQRTGKGVRRLVISRRREHSRKPDEMYERIEALAPGPYLEMFARTTRPGWDSWGAEMGLFDHGPVKTRNRPSQNRPTRARSAASITK